MNVPLAAWLEAVDDLLLAQYGVGQHDLTDFAWTDLFEDGLSPADAVETFAEENGDGATA